jgi:hypothetical protein
MADLEIPRKRTGSDNQLNNGRAGGSGGGTTVRAVDQGAGAPTITASDPLANPGPPTGVIPGTEQNSDLTAGLAPLTGFAGRYTPAMANQAYENPWYLLPDVFPGMSQASPLYQALRDFGADPLTLFNILVGSQQKVDQGAGDFINWLANLYGGMGTPGGATLDAGSLISTIFGQDKVGADASNTLGQILGAGDMSTQVRTLFNMLRDVSNAGMNPLAARGYQAAIAQAGDRYGNAQMKAGGDDTMSPGAWISANMPWLAGQ